MTNEQRYFDALKRILKYETPERLRKFGEQRFGCSGEEAIEFAYENMQQEARTALGARRRPKE